MMMNPWTRHYIGMVFRDHFFRSQGDEFQKLFGFSPEEAIGRPIDELIVPEEFAEEWSSILTEKMEEAALTVVPSGLLKSDTNISDVWEK